MPSAHLRPTGTDLGYFRCGYRSFDLTCFLPSMFQLLETKRPASTSVAVLCRGGGGGACAGLCFVLRMPGSGKSESGIEANSLTGDDASCTTALRWCARGGGELLTDRSGNHDAASAALAAAWSSSNRSRRLFSRYLRWSSLSHSGDASTWHQCVSFRLICLKTLASSS